MAVSYESAERLAIAAHGETTMPSGSRVIDHARRVATHFDPADELDIAVAAILHDTVEKGSFEFDDLRRAGVDEHIIEIVDALTRRPDEHEPDYLARCAAHHVALRIKRVDIADKMVARDHRAVDPARATELRLVAQRRLALLERLAAPPPVGIAS